MNNAHAIEHYPRELPSRMEYVLVRGKYLSNNLISKIPAPAPAKFAQSQPRPRPRRYFKIPVNPGPGKSIFLNTRPRHNFVPSRPLRALIGSNTKPILHHIYHNWVD